MRRVVPVAIVTLGLLLGSVTPALAAPSPGAQPVPGQPVCSIQDDRLVRLTGLAATDTGYAVVNNSPDGNVAMRVSFVNQQCRYQRSVGYPVGARDPQDLAVAPDGTLWIADTGDNPTGANHRTTIAVWKLAPGTNGEPVRYRLAYPDGAHDAEALLLTGAGIPVVVTKETGGVAGLYIPTGPLSSTSNNGVTLAKVGQFKPQRTGTPGFLGLVGQGLVTGGANAPDGKRVALRTYTDAYEWDVPDGDVLKAIMSGKPRVTPLPNEPQGEAIAYSRDGKSFLTVSDQQQGAVSVLRYTPAQATAAPAPGGNAPVIKHGDTRSFLQKLSLQQVTFLVAMIGVLGLAFVLIGVFGIRRSRQLRRSAASRSGPDPDGGTGAVSTARMRRAGRSTVGSAAASGESTTGSVTGSAAWSSPRAGVGRATVPAATGTVAAPDEPPEYGDDHGRDYGGDYGATTYGAPYGGTPRYGSGGRGASGRATGRAGGAVYGSAPDEPDAGYDHPRRR